ncbi:MAG TPA: hypothetical protein PLD25_32715 [Chloroflexota bacterium]|nr:hypothetical protein [Chloroflexota bacterium]HUM70193.1 hypothetical protein [Chloroflexota bacterium]
MNRLTKLFVVTFLFAVILLGFIVGVYVIPYELQKQQARRNLQAITAMELPDLDHFQTIRIVSSDFSHSSNNVTCYYARDNIILGTLLSEVDALNTYVRSLQELGWEPGWGDPLPKSLALDEHTLLEVSVGQPPPIIRHAIDYEELRKTYQTFVFVKVDYMLPNRGSCY